MGSLERIRRDDVSLHPTTWCGSGSRAICDHRALPQRQWKMIFCGALAAIQFLHIGEADPRSELSLRCSKFLAVRRKPSGEIPWATPTSGSAAIESFHDPRWI